MLLVANLYNSLQIIKSILKFNVLKNKDVMIYSATQMKFESKKLLYIFYINFIELNQHKLFFCELICIIFLQKSVHQILCISELRF